MGAVITVAEPDLQVLAHQVPSITDAALIFTVAGGVGLFLVISLLRMHYKIPLHLMLLGFYILLFVLAPFAPRDMLAVAFDSGGVTTGPVTVPFIMALGIGMASLRSDKTSREGQFRLNRAVQRRPGTRRAAFKHTLQALSRRITASVPFPTY